MSEINGMVHIRRTDCGVWTHKPPQKQQSFIQQSSLPFFLNLEAVVMLHQRQQLRQQREYHHIIHSSSSSSLLSKNTIKEIYSDGHNPINSSSTQTRNIMDNKRIFRFKTLPTSSIHHHHQQIEDYGDKENQTDLSAGLTFPTLWKKMTTNEEAFPLQLEHQQQYQHHHHILLSPTSRSKEIAKGRQEMMEMIKNMPETSYELSLKDLIMEPQQEQHQTPQTYAGDDHLNMIADAPSSTIIPDEKRKKKIQVSRTKSMENNRPFLLNVFFPAVSLGSKKNNKKQSSRKSTTTCSKVSPRPPVVMEVDQKKGFVDKECWQKRLSVAAGGSKNIIRSSDNITQEESNGSSKESSGRKTMGGFLPSWWSLYKKKIKSNKQNKSVQF